MSWSDKSVSEKPSAKPPVADRKHARGPRDPQMVRRGIFLSLASLVPALICAAIMGSQPQTTLPAVEAFHKVALVGMLAGFLVIMYGLSHFDGSNLS